MAGFFARTSARTPTAGGATGTGSIPVRREHHTRSLVIHDNGDSEAPVLSQHPQKLADFGKGLDTRRSVRRFDACDRFLMTRRAEQFLADESTLDGKGVGARRCLRAHVLVAKRLRVCGRQALRRPTGSDALRRVVA